MYRCHSITRQVLTTFVIVLVVAQFAWADDQPHAVEGEYGDAPEGVLAYPATGVVGSFPTCVGVGPAGYVYHAPWPYQFLGPMKDFEMDGNAGTCPGFAPYDMDECFMDGDAGLMKPGSYTIVGGSVVPCTSSGGGTLGVACGAATWGPSVDIIVANTHPEPAFMNVLMDWNQDGTWAPSAQTACASPEYVLIDFMIPGGYVGPLSGLAPPMFALGGNPGYVWTRFTITNYPISIQNWDGSGIFEDGESEDYLLLVDSAVGIEKANWGSIKGMYR